MATYGVRVRNLEFGIKKTMASGLTREQAIEMAESMKALETDTVKISAFIEMNQHERQVDRLIQDAVSEFIGARECTMMDFPEDSEEYQMAKSSLNHDELFGEIYDHVMEESQGNYRSHLRFAGKAFVEERIEDRLKREGYGK